MKEATAGQTKDSPNSATKHIFIFRYLVLSQLSRKSAKCILYLQTDCRRFKRKPFLVLIVTVILPIDRDLLKGTRFADNNEVINKGSKVSSTQQDSPIINFSSRNPDIFKINILKFSVVLQAKIFKI